MRPPPQQGWLRPPQPEQLPLVHVPASDEGWPQVWPAPTHDPPKQQAPFEQTSPRQQTLPGVPQLAQVALAGSQTTPALPQTPLAPTREPAGGGQHCSPGCEPQRWQEFLMQACLPRADLPRTAGLARAAAGAAGAAHAERAERGAGAALGDARPEVATAPGVARVAGQQAWPGPPQTGSLWVGASVRWSGPSAPASGGLEPAGRPLLLQARSPKRTKTIAHRGERGMAAHYRPR
jgi:hypothetical protein